MPREKQSGNGNGTNTTLALPDAQASGGLAVMSNALALQTDVLAGMEGIDLEDDGLSEIGPEDIKIGVKIWNTKALQKNGDPIPPNQFFDTLTEEVQRELDLILVKDHVTNEWREYDEVAEKSNIRCSSYDRIQGTMDDGTVRQCAGCPDAQWSNVITPDGKTKRTRPCGPVHNVYAMELDTLQPVIVRFRRKSLRVIQNYWSRHHIKRRPVRDSKSGRTQFANYPAYAFLCKVSLKMDGKFAYPVLERGPTLPAELIAQGSEMVRYVTAISPRVWTKIVEAEVMTASDDEGDTSFDTSKMAGPPATTSGGEGQDFTQ